MSMQITPADLSNVRIPAELNQELDRFFSDMKVRILEVAARRAVGRSGAESIVIVQEAELTESAREALTDSLANLTATFPAPEPRHVRIAS